MFLAPKEFPKIQQLDDWASFDVSPELLDHMTRASKLHGAASKDILTARACPRAPLTAHHLCFLADGLCDLGFVAQALAPTVCLQFLGYLGADLKEEDKDEDMKGDKENGKEKNGDEAVDETNPNYRLFGNASIEERDQKNEEQIKYMKENYGHIIRSKGFMWMAGMLCLL